MLVKVRAKLFQVSRPGDERVDGWIESFVGPIVGKTEEGLHRAQSRLRHRFLEVATGGADAAMHDTPNVLYYIKTAGNGKVILLGEHAVVHGFAAIAVGKLSGYLFPLPEGALEEVRVVVVDDERGPSVTLAGLLAVGRYPQQFLPQLDATFVVYATVSGESLAVGTRFHRQPVPDAIHGPGHCLDADPAG